MMPWKSISSSISVIGSETNSSLWCFLDSVLWILITYDVAAVKLGDDCSASQRFQSLFIHGSDVLGTCIIGIFRTSVLCLLLVTLLVRELVWQVHATRWSYFVILVKHPWSARGLVMYFFRQDWKLRVVVGLFDRRTWAGDLFPSLLCNILGVHVDRWRIPSATTGNYVLSWVCLTSKVMVSSRFTAVQRSNPP